MILTIRAFPIRVAGNSGPLANEINWETVSAEAGYKNEIKERTSVTKKIRRVAKFDSRIVIRAIEANKPTKIILNHLDYISNSKLANSEVIINNFIRTVEGSIKSEIEYVGLGPSSIKKKENKIISLEAIYG